MAMQNVWTNKSGVSTLGTSTTSVITLPEGIAIVMAFISVTTGASLRMSLQIAPTATGPWVTIGSAPSLSSGSSGSASGQAAGAGFARLIVTGGSSSNVSIWLTSEVLGGIVSGGGGIASAVSVTSMPSIPPGSNTIGSVGIISLPAIPTGTNSIGTVQVSALPALPSGTNTIGNVGVTSLTPLPTGTNTIGNVGVTSLPALPSGTNNIGIVSVTSLPAGSNSIGTVQVSSLPALPSGSNTIGNVNVTTLPTLPSGSNTIGTVGLSAGTSVGINTLPALPSGSNTIGTVNIGAYPIFMQPCSIRSRTTIALVSPLTNSAISLSGYTVVQNFIVIALTGTASISINGTNNPIPAALGDTISNMNITSMYITTTGSAGGTITLELQGN